MYTKLDLDLYLTYTDRPSLCVLETQLDRDPGDRTVRMFSVAQ